MNKLIRLKCNQCSAIYKCQNIIEIIKICPSCGGKMILDNLKNEEMLSEIEIKNNKRKESHNEIL